MKLGTDQGMLISFSPHVKGEFTVKKVMWGVVIALTPAFISSIYYYGLSALNVTLSAVLFCVAIEAFIQKFILKEKITIDDGSAVITGILLAFNVPSNIPHWQLFIGSLVAIGIAKQSFGGLGKNPFNPALVGRAFMLVSFPVQMNTFPLPFKIDAISDATPLGRLALDGVSKLPNHLDLFLGRIEGCLGEISAAAIILGGLFLLFRKIITWHIPIFYLGGLFMFTGIFWLLDSASYADPLFHLFAGGAMLGAWFMATDMTTSPVSVKGQIIFALVGGIMCGAIRLFGTYPDGVSYSILTMNAFVPLIDKWCKPKRFGKGVKYG